MTPAKLFNREIASDPDLSIAWQIIQIVRHDLSNTNKIVFLLDQLKRSQKFPQVWIQATIDALKTGDWAVVTEPFIKKQFIGQTGYFLLVLPHKLSQEKGEVVKLSAFLGQVLNLDIDSMLFEQVKVQAEDLFGGLQQPIAKLIPCRCLYSCDRFSHKDSEAFIVPESFVIPGSIEGPVINNMTQHRERFFVLVELNILRIFEPESASLLLAVLEKENIGLRLQHMEYQYHDAGHATGLGIKRKINDRLLLDYRSCAVEEWRADGAEFALASRTLTPEKFGKLIAANFYLRFGIDAQRQTNKGMDSHAYCCLITLEYLLRSEYLYIKHDRLAFRNPSYQTLAKMVEQMSVDAVYLTKQELLLKRPTEISTLYRSIKVQESTKEIFQNYIISPCP